MVVLSVNPSVPASLPVNIHAKRTPAHVAVIMDGNARWARARGLPVRPRRETFLLL